MWRSLTIQTFTIALSTILLILGATIIGILNVLTIEPVTTQSSTHAVEELDLTWQFHIALTRAVAEAKSFGLSNDANDLTQAYQSAAEAKAVLAKLTTASTEHTLIQDTVLSHEHDDLNQQRAALVSIIEQQLQTLKTSGSSDHTASLNTLEQLEGQLNQLDSNSRQLLEKERQAAMLTLQTSVQSAIASVSIAFGVILLLVVVAVWLLRRYIVEPINILAAATHRFGAGEFEQSVSVTSANELGELQAAFNQMTATLHTQTDNLEKEIALANRAQYEAEQSRARIAEQLQQIQEQEDVIREMSVPVLPLTPTTLVMPLVGALDSTRLQQVQTRALQAVEQWSARYLLLDVTGVPIIDTHVAKGLIHVVQATRLLGAEVIMVGIRPEVAQSIVGLGVQLGDVVTRATLQNGIAYALAQQP